jgi:predicted DNA-binding transcriptional regulator YafY
MSKQQRIAELIRQVKMGQHPNATSFSRYWSRISGETITARTIGRDIEELRTTYGAPLTHCGRNNGYRLDDPLWSLPIEFLDDDEQLVGLLSTAVGSDLLPSSIRNCAETALRAHLTATDPGAVADIDLSALIYATHGKASVDNAIVEPVINAWCRRRILDLFYRNVYTDETTQRQVEPHALFGSDGAWYIHGWCHLRGAWRNFALHRIQSVDVKRTTFKRDPAAVAHVRSGWLFNSGEIRDILIHVAPHLAASIKERQWFGKQIVESEGKSGLRLRITQAPKEPLIHWVMGYFGAICVVEPVALRQEIAKKARAVAKRHSGAE